MLKKSKAMMPRIPFDDIDIMIVEELGKNITGDGMDPNIIGNYSPDTMKPDYNLMPKIKRILCFNLTRETHGHAPGIGFLTCIPERMYKEINFERTWLNGLVAAVDLRGGRTPVVCPDERTCMDVVFRTLAQYKPKDLKICIIKNTLCLDDMIISEGLLNKPHAGSHVVFSETPMNITFDENNDMGFTET